MYSSYGVLVSAEEAQEHLQSLVQFMFPTTTHDGAGAGAGVLAPTCAARREVGDSITPTSRHRDKVKL